MGRSELSLTNYALRLNRTYRRILTGLLTGHADLNRHLTLIQRRTDPLYPLCQEEEETTLRLLGKRSAVSHQRLSILFHVLRLRLYEDQGKTH